LLAGHLTKLRRRTKYLFGKIIYLLNQIPVNGSPINEADSKRNYAISLATLANELQAQFKWLKNLLKNLVRIASENRSFLNRVQIPARDALGKFKAYLTPLLQTALATMWTIISKFLQVKEWKINGEVGTGVLGLVNVGVEITFEP
jgi:ABC-type transporter Mla subunit MlaD